MDRGNSADITADDLDWRDRSEYWGNYRPKAGPGRKKKFKFREPLILSGHGVRIQVDHSTLLIRNGFTHHSQKSEVVRIFPGDPNLPDRIIILDASGGITFDAIAWMSDQKIAFVQLNWRGQVTFSGNSGFAANPRLVQLQSKIWGSKKALEINCELISAKLDASGQTLLAVFNNSAPAKKAAADIQAWRKKVLSFRQVASQGQLLGYEGMAASIYYRAWHDLPLKWAGLWKRPLPTSWSKIGSRTMSWQRESNNARHPINAMLNYGYAMLISVVRAEIVAAGLDPSIGIAHRRAGNPIPLVYDLMEPLRPIVDRKVLEFSLSNTFTPGDFTITSVGGCRLNPQMAKSLVSVISEINCGNIVPAFLAKLT